jgi:acetyl-CoA/propionyl-CoA carboxylase, biotin carboxylase, biotin carboxyl carrier protein
VRDRMGAAAVRLAAGAGYEGVGTVEFLLADDGSFFFLEMNTRLQVEHPVTEAITGRDLVEDQLRVAQGLPLATSQDQVRFAGHAIEARLYAEDPEAGFLPATGPVVAVRWPDGPGIRVEAGVSEGDLVTDRYDPMLAKLVAHGETRADALQRLRGALDETLVLGVRTNLRFLRWLLAQPVVRDGEIRTDTIAHLQLQGPAVPDDGAWRAAASALLADAPGGQGPWGGGWRANAPAAARVRHRDEERRIELGPVAGERLPEIATTRGTAFVEVEGQSLELTLAMPPSVEDAVRHAATAPGRASLIAPMPGRVIAVNAVEGQLVAEHATLIVIEAMKMEHAVTSPLAGTVTRVAIREGQHVQRGDLLAEVSV